MSNAHQEYFNLHTTGIGYLNRLRKVEPKRGEAFYAVSLSALHGKVDDPEYTRFDCRICAREAQQRVLSLEPAITDDKPVLVGFKIGDIYPEAFEYRSGDKQGQTGCVIKGRLLQIRWAKIDGEHVFAEPLRYPGSTEQAAA